MPRFQQVFDRLSEHEFGWASTAFRLMFWWVSAFFAVIVLFYTLYRMKTLVASIPPIIQAACIILIVLAVMLMTAMFRERSRALQAYSRFLSALDDLKPAAEKERSAGLSEAQMTTVRRRAGVLTGKPREWWRALDNSMEYYTSANGSQGWFITRTVPECLPEEDVIDSFYHSSFHQSVPGILTALGLLATFVAILMALAGVTYNVRDPLRPVSGIDQLINGLSGKFLSSIIALILSVIFTFFEKKVCDRQLTNGYDALIKRCKDVFPLLTQARVLVDIQRMLMNRTREAAVSERG